MGCNAETKIVLNISVWSLCNGNSADAHTRGPQQHLCLARCVVLIAFQYSS